MLVDIDFPNLHSYFWLSVPGIAVQALSQRHAPGT